MSLIFVKFRDDENPILLKKETTSYMNFFEHTNDLVRSSSLSDDNEKIKVNYHLYKLDIDKNTFSRIVELIENYHCDKCDNEKMVDKKMFNVIEYLQINETAINRILRMNIISEDLTEYFEQLDLSKKKIYYNYMSLNGKYKFFLDIFKFVVVDCDSFSSLSVKPSSSSSSSSRSAPVVELSISSSIQLSVSFSSLVSS